MNFEWIFKNIEIFSNTRGKGIKMIPNFVSVACAWPQKRRIFLKIKVYQKINQDTVIVLCWISL